MADRDPMHPLALADRLEALAEMVLVGSQLDTLDRENVILAGKRLRAEVAKLRYPPPLPEGWAVERSNLAGFRRIDVVPPPSKEAQQVGVYPDDDDDMAALQRLYWEAGRDF